MVEICVFTLAIIQKDVRSTLWKQAWASWQSFNRDYCGHSVKAAVRDFTSNGTGTNLNSGWREGE